MMSRHLYFLFVFLVAVLVLPLKVGAQRPVVREVQVEGVRRIPESRVRGWLVTRPGIPADSLLLRKDMDRILDGYRAAGFWQTAVIFPQIRVLGRGVRVAFRVEEGEPTRIDSVVLQGNQKMASDGLRSALGLSRDTVLRRDRIDRALDALLRIYENRGFPYCSLRPAVSILPGQDHAVLQITVEEGPFVQIDTVRFEGNRRTRDEVLLREMRIQQGEVYRQNRVDGAVRALRRLPFIVEVEPPRLEVREGQTALVVVVHEGPTGRLEAGAGYAPGNGAQAGLTGAVRLAFDNLMGTGREGRAAWERSGESASDLELAYREPWILGRPVSAEVALSMRQRPGFVEDLLNGQVRVASGKGIQAGVGISSLRVRPDSSGLGVVSGSQAWSLDGDWGFDRRDDRWNPGSGFLYRMHGGWGRVSRRGETSVRFRYGLDAEHYFPVGRRSVIAAAFHGAGVVEQGGVPLEARLRLGGIASIRGYREEAFLVTRAFWANLEWRLRMGRRSRVFLFADLGSLRDPGSGGTGVWIFPAGFGAGMRLESRLGMLGFDYGLARGDSPAQGKVHVQMVNEF